MDIFVCYRYSSSHSITHKPSGLKSSMLMMLLHMVSCLIFMSDLICSSIMVLCMVIIQIHLSVVLLIHLIVIVLYSFLAL